MTKRAILIAVVVALLAILGIRTFLPTTIHVFGSWWRMDGLPSPEEWSAFWGSLTLLAAVGAAWLALAQLRQNADAAMEQSRPFVIVDVHFRGGMMLSIEVKNAGLTAARDVDLKWTATPVIVDAKRSDAFIRNLVDGKIPFLTPGRAIRYFVGRFPDYPVDAPRRFEVHASYLGPDGKRSWESDSVIDLDQWANSLADSDYENKNWNENQRQTKAQQEAAKQMKAVAASMNVIAEFVESQQAMKDLRSGQKAEWKASFGADPGEVARELEK